jgi:SAM-dependent methyltransferase
MTLSERICLGYLRLGHIPKAAVRQGYIPQDRPLLPLTRRFPRFFSDIKGKRIIDFGSADGDQSFALLDAGASEVLGIEILDARVDRANARRREGQPVAFAKYLMPDHLGYDIAISINSFEHFSDPDEILRQIHGALKPGGKLYMTFGPLWWSAFGPHQQDFTKMPWPHLFFSEDAVMGARASLMGRYDKRTYADRWLNQMSVAEYERIIGRQGFKVVSQQYLCTRGMSILKQVPWLREIAINRIACVLQRPQG